MKQNSVKDIILKLVVPVTLVALTLGVGTILIKDDMPQLLSWWLTLILIGAAFLPVTMCLFKNFHDKGYIFSKTIGIALSGWLMWYLSSLKLLKFTRLNGIIIIVVLFAVNIAIAFAVVTISKKKQINCDCFRINTDSVSAILYSEAFFLLLFTFWIYLKGFNAEAYGTERFMDFGFMSSMMRTEYMPPEDFWFSGKGLNYYYVGQYMCTFITKVSGVGVEKGYCLALMMLAAFAFVLPYSLVNQLFRTVADDRRVECDDWRMKYAPGVAGAVAGLAVSFAGNMHYPVYAWFLPGLRSFFTGEQQSGYWFPDATRYIGHNPDKGNDYTIHEFPSYSFVLGDLHAHVINTMFVMTVLAVLFAFLLDRKKKMDAIRNNAAAEEVSLLYELLNPHILAAGFFIGMFQMTNYWDFPIYFVVTGAVVLFSNAIIHRFSLRTLQVTAIQAAEVIILAIIVALPFTRTFEQMSTSIGLCFNHSALYQLLVLWGLPVILLVCFLVVEWKKSLAADRPKTTSRKKGKKTTVKNKEKKKFYIIIFDFIKRLETADLFAVIIGLCAFGLVLLPEIVYVRDIYEGGYARSNTMFKLTYQAYIMFAVFMAYIIVKWLIYNETKTQKRVAIAGLICLVMTLCYFGNATKSWFGDYSDTSLREGIDAAAFMEEESIEDYEAVQWINENIEGMPVMLEMCGLSYTFFNRISVFTGLPTVLGWQTHEWLWRAIENYDYPIEVGERHDDIIKIYTSEDAEEVSALIDKYNIEYIYVGGAERYDGYVSSGEASEDHSYYHNTNYLEVDTNHELLKSLGTIVFETDSDRDGLPTYIIKVAD